MNRFNTKIGLIVVALTIGLFGVALANDGNGTAKTGHRMGYGMGYHDHMTDCWTNENESQSLEDAAGLKQAREEFLKKTEELRNKIERQQLALNQELRKTEPDPDKAFDLQKELSELKSEFDQKALAHQLDLKESFPDADFSFRCGIGRGYNW